MYYEEAVVKEYGRKDGRNNKQINLGVNSSFKKKDNVIIISSDKIETFKQNLEPKTKKLEESVESLQAENQKFKDDLTKMKEEKENVIAQYNEIVENANNNLIEAKDQILELQRQHAQELKEKDAEIKELNSQLNHEKDVSKTLLVGLYAYEERGYISGLFNRTPPLAKQILKENPKPIETTKKE